MEEITLTGGTMVASSNKSTGAGAGTSSATASTSQQAASKKCQQCHSHSHGHHSHSHSGDGGQIEMRPVVQPKALDDIISAPEDEIVKALSTLFRFGRYDAVKPLIERLKEVKGGTKTLELIQQPDDGGHSLLHWSSKRVDDIRFVQLVLDTVISIDKSIVSSLINVPSSDNVGMKPLHWACTEGSIPHIAILLKHGSDLEAKDCSGCTPLLIAAQYGQVEVVAYLLQRGANFQAVDTSWDTALHWAAYKGSIQVCGLLSFYQKLDWSTQDSYGQTPLHLASLRGHTSVVRYILQQMTSTTISQQQRNRYKELLFVKDKNERTPLDLAIHKNRPTVEAVLREAMAAIEDPRGHFFRTTIWTTLKDCRSMKRWKSWLGLQSSSHTDEMDQPSKFPYYFMILNFIVHFLFNIILFAPIMNVSQGLLWDKTGWLLWNYIWAGISWYLFYKTVTTPPGYLDDSHPQIGKWRKLYEETLESYADYESELEDGGNHNKKDRMQLCHTCHVARPLRSKHCRISRKCVLLFDHFCPFVNNTIGLYNYKYFYLLLVAMTISMINFIWTLVVYLGRYRTATDTTPWWTVFWGVELCLCAFPIFGMCVYHTQLTLANLSTNEHLNVRKYKYLYPPVASSSSNSPSSSSNPHHHSHHRHHHAHRQYRNPWFKGWWGNLMDRLHPTDLCYTIPEEQMGLNASRGTSDSHAKTTTSKPQFRSQQSLEAMV